MLNNLLALFACVAIASSERSTTSLQNNEYEAFRQIHGGGDDSVSYEVRLALFQQRQAEILAHNSKGHGWIAGFNQFTDSTEEERSRMFGYRNERKPGRSKDSVSSFLELAPGQRKASAGGDAHTETFSWLHLNSSKYVRSQGGCGSCWAVASVGALEMHVEIATGKSMQLSYEQLTDCTPNPDHCGGKGGCEGATAERAYTYVQSSGLASAGPAPGYESTAGRNMQGPCHNNWTPSVHISGWERLPRNEASPLVEAVTQKGAVVISVDASGWFSYSNGIFDSCPEDAIVNHAVVLVGIGKNSENDRKYWLIRNSWGPKWGQDGNENQGGGLIKLLRYGDDDSHCGIDKDPSAGVACDSEHLKQVTVCGHCGMLYDSAYPTGVSLSNPDKEATAPVDSDASIKSSGGSGGSFIIPEEKADPF